MAVARVEVSSERMSTERAASGSGGAVSQSLAGQVPPRDRAIMGASRDHTPVQKCTSAPPVLPPPPSLQLPPPLLSLRLRPFSHRHVGPYVCNVIMKCFAGRGADAYPLPPHQLLGRIIVKFPRSFRGLFPSLVDSYPS